MEGAGEEGEGRREGWERWCEWQPSTLWMTKDKAKRRARVDERETRAEVS
jgi:hypothetical protein